MADLTITPGNVAKYSGATTDRGTAGGTITAGQALYKDAADSDSLKPAQANAAGTDDVVGISLHAALDGQPIEYITGGDLNPGATVAIGTFYVLSAAGAGGIAPWSDLVADGTDYLTLLGVAITATKLRLIFITSSVVLPTP